MNRNQFLRNVTDNLEFADIFYASKAFCDERAP